MIDAALPERIELGQRERPRSPVSRHRRRADEHRSGSSRHHPVQLLDRLLDDRQADHRNGEDAALVVEAPFLVEPLVQRVHDDVDQRRIVAHPLLDETGQRREHERTLDAQLVHQLQAGAWLAECGDGLHRLTEDLAAALAVRIAVLEVVLHRAGLGDHRERGVGDVLADLPADRDLGPTVELHVLDRVLVRLRQEAGQRVLGLVEMVVRVEQRIGQFGH